MKIKKKYAFTLIEVLIAAVVMVVALLGTISLYNRGTSLVSEIRANSIVAYAMHEQMEIIRRTSFDDVILNYPGPTNFNAAGFVFLTNPSGIVTVDDPFLDSDIARVTVQVSWDSTGGRRITKSSATLVTNGGMGG